MAETIYAAQTPSDGGNDANSNNQGNRFTIDTNGYQVTHGRVWVKTGGLPTTSKIWQLWNADTSTLLADFDCTALGTPTANAWSPWFELSSPVSISTGVTYVVTYHKQGDPGYVFSAETFPITNGRLTTSTGVYTTNQAPSVMPTTTFDALYFADIQASVPGENGTINLATEVETAFDFTATSVVDGTVGLATEVDSAFGFTAGAGAVDGSVNLATETDTAFAFTPGSAVNATIGLASEVETAFAFTPAGGGPAVTSAGDLSSTYYANQIAGTLVNGVPSLTTSAALVKWVSDNFPLLSMQGYTDVGALNVGSGDPPPLWETRNALLNREAGTDDLSDTDALNEIVNP